jgi:hypothetical protein
MGISALHCLFTEFRSKISGILPDDLDLDLAAIERRILKELGQLENDPKLYQKQQKVREKLRKVERKALVKGGKKRITSTLNTAQNARWVGSQAMMWPRKRRSLLMWMMASRANLRSRGTPPGDARNTRNCAGVLPPANEPLLFSPDSMT